MNSPDRPPSLARRALPGLALAGAAGALLLALDHPGGASSGSVVTASALAEAVASGAASSTSAAATTPATTVSPASTASTAPPSSVPAVPSTTAAAPTTTVTTTASNGTTSNGTCTGTVVSGPEVDTRWGLVQVAAEVAADGTICDVDAIEYPSDESKSLRINQRAVPVINAEVLAAQSADFDAVSGATVTSEGYRISLQAILDAL